MTASRAPRSLSTSAPAPIPSRRRNASVSWRARVRRGIHGPHGHAAVDAGAGWHDGLVQPYGPLMLEPATAVFHYAQEIFEG